MRRAYLSIAMLAATAEAGAAPLPVSVKPGHVTEATVEVDASPAEIYALVTDYARWPATLTDVSGVRVERGGRQDARVRFRSRVLEHEVVVQFENVPDRSIKFVGVEGPRGGRASGTYMLEPLDGGRRTRVVASMYLDVVGVASWFVSDTRTRSMRQAKLRVDLDDVLRAVAARHRAA
jgi:hypothetical protein